MEVKRKQLLVFGYGLPLILAFVALRLWIKHHFVVVPVCLGTAGLAVLALTLFRQDLLVPVYQVWMKGVGVIGMVLSTLVLSLFFYLVFGGAGIVLRLLGKDLLDRKLEPQRQSYWKHREKKPFDRERYTKQF